MFKKLTLACLAVAALAAFIVPASASARTVTHPTGKVMTTHPAGTTCTTNPEGCILATNVGETELQTTTGTTILRCTTAKMTADLTTNTDNSVAADITSAEFTGTGASGACTGIFTETVDPEGLPWCLRSDNTMGEDEFQVTGGLCSEAAKKVSFKLTGTANCKYESTTTTVAKGTFTTDTPSTQDAVLHVPRTGHTPTEDAGFTKVEGGIACPSSGALKMSFTLETDTPGTANPIYIS